MNPKLLEIRDPVAGVAPLFVERWSPRSFDGSPIEHETLLRIMDAARWAPSCFNEQPWRFFTSTPATFDDFVGLLQESNQLWAKSASVIGFLIGKTDFTHNGKPNRSYALDCGAAWMALALQARMEGLYTHAMAGIQQDHVAHYFKIDRAKEEVLIGFVIGRVASKERLPEALRQRETPSPRLPLDLIWRQL